MHSGPLPFRILWAAPVLVALALTAWCVRAPRPVQADTVEGPPDGDFALEITTCSRTASDTGDRVFLTLQGSDAWWWTELDHPGVDRARGQNDVYTFSWPSHLGTPDRLESLKVEKTGNNAWCISAVDVTYRGQPFWGWRHTDPAQTVATLALHPAPSVLWLDGEAKDAPSSFVRFTDLFTNANNTTHTPWSSPLQLGVATCASTSGNNSPGSLDGARIALKHDGLYDVFEVPAGTGPGADDVFRTYLDAAWYVRFPQGLSIDKPGSDDWCLRWAGIFDSGLDIDNRYWSSNTRVTVTGAGYTYTISGVDVGRKSTGVLSLKTQGLPLKRSARWVPSVAACASGAADTNCNGIDEDCDGAPDDDYNATMTCGLGACARSAPLVCQAGSILNRCVPGVPATEIAGNSKDDDCDGKTDEVRGDANQACTSDFDCERGLACEPRGIGGEPICLDPQCVNGLKDENESKADCGGVCPACTAERCLDACRVGESVPPAVQATLRFSTGTFTRAGPATYEQREGAVVAARENELRWVDRDGVRMALFEGASTNLFKQSSAWTATPPWLPPAAPQLGIGENQGPAPDGTQNAEFVAFTNGPGRGPQQSATVPGARATFSMYASALAASETGTWARPRVFALGAGDAVLGSAAFHLGESPLRYDLPFTTPSGSTASIVLSHAAGWPASDTIEHTSDDYFVWGAQLESLPFATSYIPTTSEVASRAPDYLTLTAAQVPWWMRTGHFQFDVAPLYGSDELPDGVVYTLLSYGSSTDVAFVRAAGVTRLRVRVGGATLHDRVLNWERGAKLTLSMDAARDEVSVLGTAAGTGTQTVVGLGFPSANLRIGGALGGTEEAFAALSEPRMVLAVTEACTPDASCKCGNGIVDAGEVCDVALDAHCDASCTSLTDVKVGHSDADCENGRVLGIHVGARYGLPSSTDVCWPALCETHGATACGTTSSPCGECVCEPNCAGKTCGSDPQDGCGGSCEDLCAGGAIGCTRDTDCSVGFTCGLSIGSRFGHATGSNVCWPAVCGDYDPSRLQCGTTSSPCGLCPTLPNECGARVCGRDRYRNPCGTCEAGSRCNAAGACVVPKAPNHPLDPKIAGAVEAVPTAAVGTIEGSFSVSANGTANYTVPLRVPPGRAGLQPALSLSYDSARGDGFLTKGWSLSGLGAIARCPRTYAQDGEARGVKLDDLDAFCLNGARLVVTATGPNGSWTEYRTELDSFVKVVAYGGHRTPYTGPTHFKTWTKDGTVSTYGETEQARVWAKIKNDARLDPDTQVNASWQLETITDAHGNQIRVDYEHFEMGYRLGEFAHPGYGPTDFDYTSELRPRSITYGPTGSHVVTFDYQKQKGQVAYGAFRLGRTPHAFTSGIGRYFSEPLQRISMSVDGVTVHTYTLEIAWVEGTFKLASVTQCAGADSAGTCLPPTVFHYAPVVPLENWGETWDALGGHIPLSFRGRDESIFGRNLCVRRRHGDNYNRYLSMPINIDGDAFDDLFNSELRANIPGAFGAGPCNAAAGAGLLIRSSYGEVLRPKHDASAIGRRFQLPRSAWRPDFGPGPNYDQLPYAVFDADFDGIDEIRPGNASEFPDLDGDGRRDRVKCESWPENTWSFRFGVDPATVDDPLLPFGADNPSDLDLDCRFTATDYDRDGDEDLLVVSGQAAEAALYVVSLERGRLVSRRLGAPPWVHEPSVVGTSPPLRWLDMNGDGLADVLHYHHTSEGTFISAYLGTGRQFIRTPFELRLDTPSGEHIRFEQSFVVDWDGDGRDELFMPYDRAGTSNDWWLVLQPLNPHRPTWMHYDVSQIPYRTQSAPNHNDKGFVAYDWQHPTAIDWDGNGVADILLRGGEAQDPSAVLWRGGSRVSRLLDKITDGYGRTTTITYSDIPSANSYVKGSGCTYPQRCLAKLPHPVVVAHEISGETGPFANPLAPSPGRATRRYEYRYEDGRTDVRGRGWLGFGKRTVREVEVEFPGRTISETTSVANLTLEVSSLKMFVGAAHPVRVTHRAYSNLSTGAPVVHDTLRSFDWKVQTSASGRPWLALVQEVKASAENLSNVVMTTRDRSYDGYGNVLTDRTQWSDGRMVGTTTSYVRGGAAWPAQLDRWLVGLPEHVTISSVANTDVPLAFRSIKSVDFWHTYNKVGDHLSAQRRVGDQVREETTNGFDAFGNVTFTSRHAPDSVDQTFHTYYDASGMFPVSQETGVHRALGLPKAEMGHDLGTGQLRWRREVDGTWQVWNHDGFGNLGKHVRSDGTYTEFRYGRGTVAGARFSVAVSGNNQSDTVTDYNAFGQPIYEQRWDFADTLSVREWGYDIRGRLASVTNPHLVSTPAIAFHGVEYDNLGRPIAWRDPVALADGTVGVALTVREYLSRDATTEGLARKFDWESLPDARYAVVDTDPANVQTARILNMRGEVVAAIDPGGNSTFFTYGPFGHLAQRSFLGVETTFETDELGQISAMVDPGSGTRVYRRNGLGLLTETEHNGAVTSYDFDGMGRLTHAQTPDGFYDWVWDGDGKDRSQGGKLISESVTSTTLGNSRLAYDYHGPDGALTAVHRTIEGQVLDTLIEHDALGRRELVRLPVTGAAAAEAIGYKYCATAKCRGRVTAVTDGRSTDYWKLIKTDAYGSDAEVRLVGGQNGVISRKTLSPITGQLMRAETLDAAGEALQSQSYEYDVRGLLSHRADAVHGVSETFVNDVYGRLSLQTHNGTPLHYGYDAYGNLTRKPGVGALHYEQAGQPTLLTSTDSGSTFEYDAAGDGTQTLRMGGDTPGGRQEIAYTSFDLPTRIANGAQDAPSSVTTYGYDARNSRTVEQVEHGSRTIYAGDLYRRIQRGDGSTEQVIRIPTPGGALAEVSIDAVGTRTVQALHTDHLGSTVAVTDGQGLLRESRTIDPFGRESRSGVGSGIRAGFTGHEHDGETAFINMRGRMYDPTTGRFLTPDPMVHDLSDSQSWNRYSYVRNDPLNATDPSGFDEVTERPVTDVPVHYDPYYGLGDFLASLSTQGTDALGPPLEAGTLQLPTDVGAQQSFAMGGLYADATAWMGRGSDIVGPREMWEGAARGLIGGAMLVGSMVPYLGEVGDAYVLTAPDTSALDRAAAVMSLAVSVVTAGLAPNYAAMREAGKLVEEGGRAVGASGGKTFFRSMSEAEANAVQQTGQLRGGRPGETFFTDSKFRTAGRAQDRLSLPQRPGVQMEFRLRGNPNMSRNGTRVAPDYGGRGGGREFSTFDPVDVEVVNVQPYLF